MKETLPKKRLLEIIAKHGDGWWNENDSEDESIDQANAEMVLDELASFLEKEGLCIILESN